MKMSLYEIVTLKMYIETFLYKIFKPLKLFTIIFFRKMCLNFINNKMIKRNINILKDKKDSRIANKCRVKLIAKRSIKISMCQVDFFIFIGARQRLLCKWNYFYRAINSSSLIISSLLV